jgi:shikimate kinase
MILKKNLVFLGMMGSGKSSIGSLISTIFIRNGEDYFRNLEEKVTIKILKSRNSIIALGGGAFINEKIQKQVLSNNFSFWLKWDTKILLKRINRSKKRPLAFNVKDLELIDLIKRRSKVYSNAQFKINCDNLSKTEIVKKILNINELYKNPSKNK